MYLRCDEPGKPYKPSVLRLYREDITHNRTTEVMESTSNSVAQASSKIDEEKMRYTKRAKLKELNAKSNNPGGVAFCLITAANTSDNFARIIEIRLFFEASHGFDQAHAPVDWCRKSGSNSQRS